MSTVSTDLAVAKYEGELDPNISQTYTAQGIIYKDGKMILQGHISNSEIPAANREIYYVDSSDPQSVSDLVFAREYPVSFSHIITV